MRPLNRPMFKYGGPIKEGIMDGMREPKKDGKIVGGKQSPLLAGAHPLKDAEGREQHFIPALYAAGLAAVRAAPLVYRGFKAARTFAPGNLGFMGRLKDLTIGSGRFRKTEVPFANVNKQTGKVVEGFKPGKDLSILQALKDPQRLGAAIREYPFLALSTPSLATSAVTGGGPIALDAAKGVANFLVPGTRFDPFGPEKAEPPKGDGTGLKRGDKSKNVGDTSVTGTTKPGEAGGATVKSDAEKQQINEDRINETKQKYYKLMGIDKMNKDAVYDSLIDASKIVSEEGADLKGSIRSGNLQNRIIQAISANLDKSADLKKQIDAAVLKGEIEKDIRSSDPSNEILNRLREVQIKKGEKELKGSSAAEVLATAEIQGKNLVTSNTLTSILSSKGTNVDFTFPDDKYQKWEKNNKNKDEIDYLTENYGSLEDGTYVVNKKAFEVKDGSVFPIDLDKITG